MGASLGALLDLGAVGAEYQQPAGLILDFLAGEEGGPEIPKPPFPRPLPRSLQGRAAVSRAAAASGDCYNAVQKWGEGP